MEYVIQLVNKKDIAVGDTILCKDGVIRTVCSSHIVSDSFMGLTIFGDSYSLGYEKVPMVMN